MLNHISFCFYTTVSMSNFVLILINVEKNLAILRSIKDTNFSVYMIENFA